MEPSKDVLIAARSTIRKKDTKGRDVLTVYFTPEVVEQIITCLEATRGNEKGAKMTFHTGKKEHEGRSFDSTFGFVKAVSEGGAAFGGARPAGRFVAKSASGNADRDAKIAGINAKKLG